MGQKIVFFDIDGTLYERRSGLGIPESTGKAVKRLQAKGNLAFICTGRTLAELEDIFREFGFDGMICGCGTYISYKNEILHYRTMDVETIKKMVEIAEKYDTLPVLEGRDHVYFDDSAIREDDAELNRVYHNYLNDFAGYVRPLHGETWEEIQKITIRVSNQENPALRNMYAELLEYADLIDHGFALECIPAGYNKASGIERLIKALHIDRKDTYAFGDSLNDKEMLEYVEYGIAMGNSVPEILALAKYCTDALYEDGIYKACEKFGLI